MEKAPLIRSLSFAQSRQTTILLSLTFASPFCARMNSTSPSGEAYLSPWNWIVAPFGPTSSFAIPAFLHSALIRTTTSSVSTSRGSLPKRSISSAAKPSSSTLVVRSLKRR